MGLQKPRENGRWVYVGGDQSLSAAFSKHFLKRAPKTTVLLRLGAFIWEAYMVRWAALYANRQSLKKKYKKTLATDWVHQLLPLI